MPETEKYRRVQRGCNNCLREADCRDERLEVGPRRSTRSEEKRTESALKLSFFSIEKFTASPFHFLFQNTPGDPARRTINC